MIKLINQPISGVCYCFISSKCIKTSSSLALLFVLPVKYSVANNVSANIDFDIFIVTAIQNNFAVVQYKCIGILIVVISGRRVAVFVFVRHSACVTG